MNGSRSTYMRKGYLLTALAAAVLLAASSGTAWAQSVTIDSVTLSPTTVDEGGEATATVKFTVMAGPTAIDNDVVADTDVTVGFAWDDTGLMTGPRATNADNTSFSGLTETESENTEFVSVAAIRANSKRQYTATRTFRLNHDLDAENGQFKLGVTVSNWAAVQPVSMESTTATFTIKDDETQTYTLSIPSAKRGAITEGDTTATMVTLTADPKRTVAATVPGFTVVTDPNNPALYTFAVENTFVQGATPGPSALAMGNDGASAMVAIGTILALPDKNREDDTITLNLYTGGVGSASVVTDLSLVATDINKLAAPAAITAVAKDAALNGDDVTEIVEGGDPVYLTITVDRGTSATKDLTTGEELTVDIRAGAAQAGDYEVDPVRVTLPGKDSGKSTSDVDIVLTALSDEDVGTEALVLNLEVSGETANGSGSSTGTFTIPIVDKTTTKVEPKSQDEAYPAIMAAMEAGAGEDGLNPGESFSVMTSDLFTVADGYTVAYGASVEGGAASVSASGDSVTVDAKSAGEAKVTVTATAKMAGSSFIPSQTVSNIAEITFPVTVVDKPLVVTVAADPAEIMEGGTSTITATANRAVEAGDGAVEINLEVVGDATLDANSITIATGDMSGSAMLTATEDDDYADETVTVVATGSGIDAARQIAIAVTDNDVRPEDPKPTNTIVPRSEEEAYPVITGAIEAGAGDEGLNPGESFSVMASDLFTLVDGYTASYGVSVDGDAATASASGDSVSVTADMAGEAKVTITGTSRMASSSFAPEQVATNVADITFLVTVVDKPLAALVVMLEMPANVMNGNIVEGESYDIVVSANRAVTEDTDVMIMRDRAGSDAGEDDYSVSMATIMTGYDSATAELMVTEDMMPDSGTNDNMGEQLVLFGMVNGEQTNALTFTIWDQAVPALPLFGQLLLALFLMLGGARLYRRRQG